jgi:Zn-dependent protease with chaperone function
LTVSDHAQPGVPVDPASPDKPPTIFFDGLSNQKHLVDLRFHQHGLDLIENGLGIGTWAYGDLRKTDGPPGALRLTCMSTLPLARLEIRDPDLQRDILSRCGALAPNSAAARAQVGRIVAWSLGAVASITLVTVYGIPFLAERLTPLIPFSFEQRMGDASEQQIKLLFGSKICTGAEGKAALTKLVNTLAMAGELKTSLQSEVLPSPIPNALALAGGKVFVLDGLLRRAETVDELAGVLAHELGHVAHRDHVRRIIHDGGTSFLIGLLFGDVTGSSAIIFATRTLIESSYSRDAETNADAFAVAVMHKLGRSPKPLGDFLFRITGADKSGLSILASHPVTEARRDAMTAADRPNTGAELLSQSEWQALKRICR